MTHPNPSNFMGATFLKQALIDLAPDRSVLQQPVTDAAYAAALAPFWAWYDALRPNLWRGGESFPDNQSEQERLMTMVRSISASALIPPRPPPRSRRVYCRRQRGFSCPRSGSLGNVSFVAIPFNAAHVEGAEVVANFLLAPATQAHMRDITVLGSFAVLDPAKLDDAAEAAFAALPTAPALPALSDLGPTLLEPHASWMTRLTEDWKARYAK